MEKIYPEDELCQLESVGKATIQFLLDYSKSYKVLDYQNMKFESCLN